MRAQATLTVLCLLATTSLSGCAERADLYTADLASVLRGEKSIEEMAAEIVAREFNPHAKLEVKRVIVRPIMLGYEGEVVEADPGYAFFHTRVRLVNDGTLDLSVSTWQFSGVDEAGSETGAELPMAHQDFDAERVRKGGAREGWVVFEMDRRSTLTEVIWSGLLTDARGTFNGTMEYQDSIPRGEVTPTEVAGTNAPGNETLPADERAPEPRESNLRVGGVYGNVSEGRVDNLTIHVVLRPGSAPEDLSHLRIRYDDGTNPAMTLAQAERGPPTATLYRAIWLRGGGSDAVIRDGDLVALHVDLGAMGDAYTLSPRTDVGVSLLTEPGTLVPADFRTPDGYGSSRHVTLR